MMNGLLLTHHSPNLGALSTSRVILFGDSWRSSDGLLAPLYLLSGSTANENGATDEQIKLGVGKINTREMLI